MPSFPNSALLSIMAMAQRCILKHYGLTALVATIVARFSPSLNSPCRLTTADGQSRDRIWVGNYGEQVATAWLRSKRCKILARNFRGPRKGEVDIVARDRKLLLFVEVKTRREGARIRGLDAVGRDKQSLIERGANAWLKQLGTRNIPWRFDVIEVVVEDGKKPSINHVKDAF
jgi:putative endonuclease